MTLLLRFLICFFAALVAVQSQAAVAVVSNRIPVEMRFSVIVGGSAAGSSKNYSVPAGDLVVINLPGGEAGKLLVEGNKYDLKPDTAYYLGQLSNGSIDLGQITFSTPPQEAPEPVVAAKIPLDPFGNPPVKLQSSSISVKIFVDEEEATRPAIWSRRLRARIAEASEILQKHCGMGLEVVDTGTWNSDNKVHDFDAAVAEFIKEADPGKARVAIGFSSQYQLPRGRTHLGGTRGPLQRHILLREWSNHVSESERLELLVHELGHHLGAAHSPETDAVMRPILGDRQARAKKFIIHFDPVNTLAMNLVAEEMRDRGISQFSQLSSPTKFKLQRIYTDLVKALPEDPAARIYIQRLGLPPTGK